MYMVKKAKKKYFTKIVVLMDFEFYLQKMNIKRKHKNYTQTTKGFAAETRLQFYTFMTLTLNYVFFFIMTCI